jgi:hypothetical protein
MEKPEKIINSVLSFRNLTKLRMEKCVTSPIIMEQLGKLVQLESLHTGQCLDDVYDYEDDVSYDALSNLQSLHTLECTEDSVYFSFHLACISMKNLRILKSSDLKVIEVLLKADPPAQLKELWFTRSYRGYYSNLWNYLARVTSLTHLSLPKGGCYLDLPDGSPPPIFCLPEIQYLHIHVALAPHFANQPMKEMKIDTESKPVMEEVRQHWQGIVFPHVEHLKTDRLRYEMDLIPRGFWREFLLNVNTVCEDHVSFIGYIRP